MSFQVRIFYRTDNNTIQKSERKTHDRRNIRPSVNDIRLQGFQTRRDGKAGGNVHTLRLNRRDIRTR